MSTRILMIDPNIPFMVTLKQALEGTGAFEVSVSANGLAAQEILRDSEFDLAVIDLSVADMDIAALINRLREIRPNLRLVLSYSTAEQAQRASQLGAQATIAKPYMARELIARLDEVISRRVPSPEPPPEELFSEPDLWRLTQTRALSGEPDPAATDALVDWQDIDQTASLRKTDALSEEPSPLESWIENEAVSPFLGESPAEEADTPTFPPADLDSVHQFLATDEPAPEPSTFGEVLDALAQTPLHESPPSPDDQAFHELVDSLRAPDTPARRSTLEDLFSTPEDEALPVNPLDYVLDSIRRGQSPREPDTVDDSELDNATIGDVIGGLFDPSFQGVLAAMAGEEIEDDDFVEPTYADDTFAAGGADRIEALDFGTDDDTPDWLRQDTPIVDTGPVVPPAEPPSTEEDSKHYPATAALSAVSDETPEPGFSLNDLLSQIEQQLPPARDKRPRLRPLPSWEANASPEEAERLKQLFPAGEEWETGDIEEIFPEPTPAPPPDWIERVGAEDATPVNQAPVESERLGAEWDAFADEAPAREALPVDFEQLLEQADEAEPAERDEPNRVAMELDLDEDLIDAVQRAAAEDPFALIPAEEDDDTLATEITEAFYEGVRQTAYDWDQTPAPEPAAEADNTDWQTEPDDEEPLAYAGLRPDLLPEDDEPIAYTGPRREVPPEEEEAHAPGDDAARAEEVSSDDAEAARLAQIALELTQYSLESSAQATTLTYNGELIAEAGDLSGPALDRLERAIQNAWSTSPPDYDSLSRFITLPDLGEFLLFSMVVADGMILSMIFNANTPVRTIRRQARRLSESLALVPERPEPSEPPTSVTHPSRPTDLRAPEGLRAPPAPHEQPAPTPRSPRPDTPYASYTVLWLPWDPRLELSGEYAQALRGWIESVAQERAWDIDAIAIETDYVQLAIQVPQKSLPDGVIHTLFDETARRTAEHFPELIDGAGRLWANGYYVVTPPRELSEREIGRFITYQRQAQTS